MKTVDKTAFPYFGIYLSDLTLIQEKYQTKIAGGLINFSKMRFFLDLFIYLFDWLIIKILMIGCLQTWY